MFNPIIIFPQPEPDEFFEWLTNLETVRSVGPELLACLRSVLGDMESLHITTINYYEAKRLVDKMPII